MTTTSQDDDSQQKPADLESTAKADAASTGDKGVPVGEHIELRQKLRAAEEAKAALERRLADAEKKPASMPSTQESPDLAQEIRELKRRDTLRDIKVEMSLGTKQAEAILGLMDKMPGLNRDEARTLAAARDPGLFEADSGGADGFQEGVHGASRPRPGSVPSAEPESDTPARLDAIQKLRKMDKRQANRLMDNLIGSMAARQVGKPGHQRLPIPKIP